MILHPVKNNAIDMKALEEAVKAGAVKKFKHPEHDIFGYDYSKECSYGKMWDDHPITNICRGLVLDGTGNIIALPFPKFFNFSEPECDVKYSDVMQLKQFDALVKEDGSLGIIFFYNNKWNVMTRGSFTSDQAIKAQSWLDNNISVNTKMLKTNITYLAEIIYPENRIVLDYNGYTGFILLGGYDINTFEDLTQKLIISDEESWESRTQWCPYEISWLEFCEHVKNLNHEYEGYVVIMPDGRRFKMKGDEYCRLHKIKDNLSEKFIWEYMFEHGFDHLVSNYFKLPDALGINIPEEYLTEMTRLWTKLVCYHDMYTSTINMKLSLLQYDIEKNNLITQKDIAMHIMNTQKYKDFSGYLFSALKYKVENIVELQSKDNKIFEKIMKDIKPVNIKENEESDA